MRKVKVIPLSTKMRNKVKEHGDIWECGGVQPDGRVMISTLKPVHKGGHPYSVWVIQNKDCKLEVL
jgi:hypothetical protein